jgi:exosortase/archaeosortase family protein
MGAAAGMPETQETTLTPEQEAQLRRENRKRIIRFVSVFVITTLALLTSYRYAIRTRLNDWYLFQAAKHTTMTLDKIGHAELEPLHYGRYDIQKTRATIAAWAAGREEPKPEEITAAPRELLTSWERWSYRALEMRRSDTPRINGPRIYFVLRQGISTEIDAVVGKINELEENLILTPEEKSTRLTALNEELQTLRKRQQSLRNQADGQEADTSLTFPFILIPECGAIEIMAIFLAAVLAFPTLWWKRFIGLAAGLPIMYGVNVLRLTVLAVIGAMDKSRVWFNFAHEYVWQAVYIIFVVAVWLLWVEYIVKGRHA